MDELPLSLIVGLAAVVLAAAARLADRRRMRRSDPDAVGFMPWTTVFFWACLAAVLLLALGAREWIGR
jgi:hypothetical protein